MINKILFSILGLAIIALSVVFGEAEAGVMSAACAIPALVNPSCEIKRIPGIVRLWAIPKDDVLSFTVTAPSKAATAIVKAAAKAFVELKGDNKKGFFQQTIQGEEAGAQYFQQIINWYRNVADAATSAFLEAALGQELILVAKGGDGIYRIAGNVDNGLVLGAGTDTNTGAGTGGTTNGTLFVFTSPFSAESFYTYTGTEADLLLPGV